jgi:hypothetical protein
MLKGRNVSNAFNVSKNDVRCGSLPNTNNTCERRNFFVWWSHTESATERFTEREGEKEIETHRERKRERVLLKKTEREELGKKYELSKLLWNMSNRDTKTQRSNKKQIIVQEKWGD